MSSVNKAILVGNLGQDPEVRSLQGGGKVVTLSVATSEKWTDKRSGEKREKTEWHRVVIWNETLARVAETYLKKGAKVYVEGRLETRKWQDQSGQDRWSTEVVLRAYGAELVLLGGREAQGGAGHDRMDSSGAKGSERERNSAPAPSGAPLDDLDDEIPF